VYSINRNGLKCAVGGPRVAGYYNMSITLNGYTGTLDVRSSTWQLAPSGGLYMFHQAAGGASGQILFTFV
jgi:hypothetical protein